MATALGGRVERAPTHQVGWHPVTPEAGSGLPAGPWMQWHYDRFQPPVDASVIAHEVGVQAFTIRRHLGVQFHPEVTRSHLEGWIEMGGAEELRKVGVDPAALLDETAAIEPDVTRRTNQLVDWFLADVAKL